MEHWTEAEWKAAERRDQTKTYVKPEFSRSYKRTMALTYVLFALTALAGPMTIAGVAFADAQDQKEEADKRADDAAEEAAAKKSGEAGEADGLGWDDFMRGWNQEDYSGDTVQRNQGGNEESGMGDKAGDGMTGGDQGY